jgi:hypothetical protein
MPPDHLQGLTPSAFASPPSPKKLRSGYATECGKLNLKRRLDVNEEANLRKASPIVPGHERNVFIFYNLAIAPKI